MLSKAGRRTATPSLSHFLTRSFAKSGGEYHNQDPRNVFSHAKIRKGVDAKSILRKIDYRHNWDYEGHDPHSVADHEFMKEADPEDPFDEHALPFYMEYQWHDQEQYETQLRQGMWWCPKDRIQKYVDIHAWETTMDHLTLYFRDNHHNKAVDAFLQYPDILWPWDDKYEYDVKQLENHVSMFEFIPHCQHLMPQLVRELKDLGATRVTHLKERFDVKGVDYLEPGEEMKRMRTFKHMYRDPDSGPMVHPWYGERQTNQERLPPEQGAAIERWRGRNPERAPLGPETEKARLAAWILQFEQQVDDMYVEKEVSKHKWVKMFFIDGMSEKHRVYGMVGETLLEVTRRWEVPLDGWCMGGDRHELYSDGPRCQYCQIDVAPRWIHTLPPLDWKEEHWTQYYRVMTPTSRLACQIVVTEAMDGFTCSIPSIGPSVGLSHTQY